MNTNMTNHDTPAELRPTEAALNTLARAEQDAAPATLEARIFVATRGLLPAAADAPVVVIRRTSILTRMRIAASVAIVGGLAALWLAQGVAPSPAPRPDIAGLEADVNFILAMKSEGLANTRDTIDALYLDAEALSAAFKKYDSLPSFEGSM